MADCNKWRTSSGKTLVNMSSPDEVIEKDRPSAEDLFRDVAFDEYSETADCQMFTGVELKDFKRIVNRMASRYQFPDNVTESILRSEHAANKCKVIREFKFKLGATGRVVYGVVAIIKRKTCIDLAYSIYFLDFKFSAERNIDAASSPRLLFWTSTDVNVRMEECNDEFLNFYRLKVLETFKQEYPSSTILCK